ncbi:MAG: putative 2OG-Fe(II) oxygenase [Sphingomonas sp.]|jgi:tetratricopeptide (TPR) repeat protein
MAMIDLSRRFNEAEQAYAAGHYQAAAERVAPVLKAMPRHPAVLHLAGLIEAAMGKQEAACALLEKAAKLDPANAEIRNNLGSQLDRLGKNDAALSHYDAALKLSPGRHLTRMNRGIVRQRAGDLAGAIDDLTRAASALGRSAPAWAALGSALVAAEDFDAAARAFDTALEINPAHPMAQKGRARVALERAEPGVAEMYQPLAQDRSDPDILLGLAEALLAQGLAGQAAATIADHLDQNPAWMDGRMALYDLYWEAGDTAKADALITKLLDEQPQNNALWEKWLTLLAQSERFEPLVQYCTRARAALGDQPFVLAAAMRAAHAQQHVCAAQEIAEKLDANDAAQRLLLAEHWLRSGQADRAAATLEPVAKKQLRDVAVWAHLTLAWQLTGDKRYHWVAQQPGLVTTLQLALSDDHLVEISQILRQLHIARQHPLAQSMRGGTQTRGRLFARVDPAIRRLRDAVLAAINTYIAGLPPADPTHPLLAFRDTPHVLAGSWSVRLTKGGRHISHFHPAGWLSSACYLTNPFESCADNGIAGRLLVGPPPREWSLKTVPAATIAPHIGTLALFPSYLWHGTVPTNGGERMTVAFDVR